MIYKNINDVEQFKIDYDLLTIKDLCNKYNIHKDTVWKYVKRMGINRPRGSKRIYQVNDNFFSTTNECPEKYYILGLIYTDGNLPIKNRNSVIISNIDLQLLQDVVKAMDYTGPLTKELHNVHNKIIYKLQITSPSIRKDLENLGLTPNKTFNMKFPNIPQEYIRDFVRGLWDGDGGACNPLLSGGKKGLTSHFCSANLDFITELVNILPVNKKSIYKRTRKTDLYSIQYRGLESLKIKDFMYYDNCLCMNRKKDIFYNYSPRRSETIISCPTL